MSVRILLSAVFAIALSTSILASLLLVTACSSSSTGTAPPATDDAGGGSSGSSGSSGAGPTLADWYHADCTKLKDSCACFGGPTQIESQKITTAKIFDGDPCTPDSPFHEGQDMYCCTISEQWPEEVAGKCECFGRQVWGCELDVATGTACTCRWRDWGWDQKSTLAAAECTRSAATAGVNNRCCVKKDECTCDTYGPTCDPDEGTGASTCGAAVAPGVSKKPTGVAVPVVTCPKGLTETSFCSH